MARQGSGAKRRQGARRKLYRQWTKADVRAWRQQQAQYDGALRTHLFMGGEKRCACCYLLESSRGLKCVDLNVCAGTPEPILVMQC